MSQSLHLIGRRQTVNRKKLFSDRVSPFKKKKKRIFISYRVTAGTGHSLAVVASRGVLRLAGRLNKEEANYAAIWGKSILGQRQSECRNSEEGADLARKRQKAEQPEDTGRAGKCE